MRKCEDTSTNAEAASTIAPPRYVIQPEGSRDTPMSQPSTDPKIGLMLCGSTTCTITMYELLAESPHTVARQWCLPIKYELYKEIEDLTRSTI